MRIRAGIVALGLTALMLPACNVDTPNTQAEKSNTTTGTVENKATTPDNNAGASSTASGDLSSLIGKETTVRSDVQKTIGTDSFVLNTQGNVPVLVVNASGQPFTVPKEQNIPVQVTGKVESFNSSTVSQNYGLNLDQGQYTNYENKPAIIAQSVALAPQPEDLYKSPTSYVGQTIAVEGDVRKLEGANNAFALMESGWADDIGILVINASSDNINRRSMNDGEHVAVTGQAQKADAALLQNSNIGWNSSQIQEFLSRYTGRPVIVAKEVYPSAVEAQ
jgi:hypothetical protein